MHCRSRSAFRSLVEVCLCLFIPIPAFAGFPATEVFLPAVGRVTGAGSPPAQFYTTVWATNLTSSNETFTFEFLKQGQANASPAKFSDSLLPGQTKVYENIVEDKLGLSSAIGAARVTSSGEIMLSERIYNQLPGDDVGNSEGLFFAGVPKSFSISLGQSATIQGVDQGGSEDFRYNFALVETGGGTPTVHVALLDDKGATLGSHDYILQPYEQLQPNVANLFASVSTINARVVATVTAGTGSVLLAGAQVANQSQDSSGFEMSFRGELLGSGGTAGVTSLNGLTGALALTPGSGIQITPAGTAIQIAYTGGGGSGLTQVTHDVSLAGLGTGASPLAVANGQVVRSLNGLHDAVALQAGSNVTITPSGSTLTIASSGGGLVLPFAGATSEPGIVFSIGNTDTSSGDRVAISGLAQSTGAAVQGVNTYSLGLGVLGKIGAGSGIGQILGTGVWGDSGDPSGVGVYGTSPASGVWGNGKVGVRGDAPAASFQVGDQNAFGVYGILGTPSGYVASVGAGVRGDSASAPGVIGTSDSQVGVYAHSNTSVAVQGVSATYIGVWGESKGSGYGVYGASASGVAVYAAGSFGGTGAKYFIEPHPTDPTKEIRYVCLEGPESGTYFRGTGHIVNGFSTIDVPENFRMVTSEKGLTVIAMPVGEPAMLVCVKKSLDKIVLKGSADVEFDYMVNGVRKAFEGFQPVSENRDFVPRGPNDKRLTMGLPAESVRRLKANGILNNDGSINVETAHRLGWDKQKSWKRTETAQE
jgi:hypothetical protein